MSKIFPTKPLNQVAYSPNGKYIASGSSDGYIKVYDPSKDIYPGNELYVLGKHCAEITVLSFSPNNEFLMTGSFDGTLCIWNSSSGTLVHSLTSRHSIRGGIWSPNGDYFTSVQHQELSIWDVSTGKKVFSEKGNTSPVFSPDGLHISVASDANLLIYRNWKDRPKF